MKDMSEHDRRREELKQRYPVSETGEDATVGTGGLDHLALICSDIDATIRFYTEVLNMRLTRIVPNRDDPTSTHIFLDMGGGNLLAFFDFPEHGLAATVRGVGAMHHIAIKATPEQYRAVVANLKEIGHVYGIHGSEEEGAVYIRDPDDILVEVTTGY